MVKSKEDNSSNKNSSNEQQIESLGYSSFIFALGKCFFLGMAMYILFNYSKIDTYISAGLGTIIGILILLFFIYIIKNKGSKDIIDLNINIFGKFIGNVLNFVLIIFVITMASIILYNLATFFNTQYLADTNALYIRLIILIPVVYAATKDIATISRISQVIMFITMIMFVLSFLGLGQWFDINNFYPILENGFKIPLVGALIFALFSTAPVFLLTIISRDQVNSEKHQGRKIIIMYILASIVLIGVIVGTLSVYGYDVISIYKYPEYMVLKQFSLFNIIERLENTLAIQFIFDMFLYMVLSIYFIIKTSSKVIKSDKLPKFMPYVIAILMLVIVNIVFKYPLEATTLITQYVPYLIGFGLMLPMFITFLGLFIKQTILKKQIE